MLEISRRGRFVLQRHVYYTPLHATLRGASAAAAAAAATATEREAPRGGDDDGAAADRRSLPPLAVEVRALLRSTDRLSPPRAKLSRDRREDLDRARARARAAATTTR